MLDWLILFEVGVIAKVHFLFRDEAILLLLHGLLYLSNRRFSLIVEDLTLNSSILLLNA